MLFIHDFRVRNWSVSFSLALPDKASKTNQSFSVSSFILINGQINYHILTSNFGIIIFTAHTNGRIRMAIPSVTYFCCCWICSRWSNRNHDMELHQLLHVHKIWYNVSKGRKEQWKTDINLKHLFSRQCDRSINFDNSLTIGMKWKGKSNSQFFKNVIQRLCTNRTSKINYYIFAIISNLGTTIKTTTKNAQLN